MFAFTDLIWRCRAATKDEDGQGHGGSIHFIDEEISHSWGDAHILNKWCIELHIIFDELLTSGQVAHFASWCLSIQSRRRSSHTDEVEATRSLQPRTPSTRRFKVSHWSCAAVRIFKSPNELRFIRDFQKTTCLCIFPGLYPPKEKKTKHVHFLPSKAWPVSIRALISSTDHVGHLHGTHQSARPCSGCHGSRVSPVGGAVLTNHRHQRQISQQHV